MFFNIFVYKPDSSVYDFVKRYFPAFTEKYEPGGWIMYPPGPPPQLTYTVHSLMFKKHPFFNAKFREGKLDILASEEKDGRRGVRDFQLWFMFSSKAEAQKAYDKLTGIFEKVSKSKRIQEKDGKTIAEYFDKSDTKNSNGVIIILTKDEILNNRYKLFFRDGNYDYIE